VNENQQINNFKKIIEEFEQKKLEGKAKSKKFGEIYTPIDIVKLMVIKAFQIYLGNLFNLNMIYNNEDTFFDKLKGVISKKKGCLFLKKSLQEIRILDPSCGSGRFLVQSAEFLLKIYKNLFSDINPIDLKRRIIENNLFGIDFEKEAFIISKLHLFLWMVEEEENNDILKDFKEINLDSLNYLESKLKKLDIEFNIYNIDYLLEYSSKIKFNIIIGNPPYIDNKNISDSHYKKQLYNSFESAYKLFDISILFMEKSLQILKPEYGIFSFIITNKFLASNYGVKIRKILLKNTKILQITNISSFPVFSKHSTYPIIITVLNEQKNIENKISIEKFETFPDFINQTRIVHQKIIQNKLINLPEAIIPLNGDINFINSLFSKFQYLDNKFSDLKIIYRPYAFTNYKKYYEYVSEKKSSEDDLILLGTGNVGHYHIKFRKRIRIANQNLSVSYFHFPNNKSLAKELSSEKLIFREIAKDLTCVYDPGIFTNITGLYFIKIPSLSTDELFCLLNVLNSKFIDNLFKNLYNSLHMSGGYLRFNASFIKKLPIPDILPSSLANLGKILQFLYQYQYDSLNSQNFHEGLTISQLKTFPIFFRSISEALIRMLYLSKLDNGFEKKYSEVNDLLYSKNMIPKIEFFFPKPYFSLSEFTITTKSKVLSSFSNMNSLYNILRNDKERMEQIEKINSLSL